MTRLLTTALVLVLLGGTAAAFAITEKLKLEKTPITSPDITKAFSPLSEQRGTATVDFKLRKSDRITVEIVHGDETVATLATGVHFPRGPVHLIWDGRDESGQLVPEGLYKPRVHLDRARRTIVMPNPIRVDLTAPRVSIASVRPKVISPDHDGRAEFARVRFRVNEAARALLVVDGRQQGRACPIVRGRTFCRRLERRGGKLNWFGKVDERPLRPGLYTISLRAEDGAGNVSPDSRGVRVRIRYVDLPRNVIRVGPNRRFRVRVDTDARRVTWRLGGRSRQVSGKTLRLRSPKVPGRYVLFVTANGHGDRATVVVRRQSK